MKKKQPAPKKQEKRKEIDVITAQYDPEFIARLNKVNEKK